jgi:hypothetical protein
MSVVHPDGPGSLEAEPLPRSRPRGLKASTGSTGRTGSIRWISWRGLPGPCPSGEILRIIALRGRHRTEWRSSTRSARRRPSWRKRSRTPRNASVQLESRCAREQASSASSERERAPMQEVFRKHPPRLAERRDPCCTTVHGRKPDRQRSWPPRRSTRPLSEQRTTLRRPSTSAGHPPSALPRRATLRNTRRVGLHGRGCETRTGWFHAANGEPSSWTRSAELTRSRSMSRCSGASRNAKVPPRRRRRNIHEGRRPENSSPAPTRDPLGGTPGRRQAVARTFYIAIPRLRQSACPRSSGSVGRTSRFMIRHFLSVYAAKTRRGGPHRRARSARRR